MHLHTLFSAEEMKTSRLAGPFDFTKDMPLLQIDALKDARRIPMHDNKLFDPEVGTTLYDLSRDPKQLAPFRDPAIESTLQAGIVAVLAAHDAPPEIYARYRLPSTEEPTRHTLEAQRRIAP
jgi:hypothetical protein